MMPGRDDVEDRDELQKRDIERVEAFSDGVFAFAVTLMVLAIRIPRPSDPDSGAGLQHLLLAQWPSYVAFAQSFTVVGTVWANHRLAFGHLVRSTHVLVSLNLLELMAVAFLPLPTAVLGSWIGSTPANRLAAVLFYGGTLFVLGIMHNVLWWYAAYRAGLTSRALSVEKRRALTLTWLLGPVLYGIAVALAIVDPRLSIGIFIILGIVYLLPTPHVLAQAQQARARRHLRK
jgi:TMEM175 potassium channel family protein